MALPIWLTIPLAIPVAAFAGSLAFLKIHDRPFIVILNNAFNYFTSARLYIWKKEEGPPQKITVEELKKEPYPIKRPKLTEIKLKDLSWSLDVQEKLKR